MRLGAAIVCILAGWDGLAIALILFKVIDP